MESRGNSVLKAAFATNSGLVYFNVLPFGLCNGPATLMKATISGLRHQLAGPNSKKEPVTEEMITKMADSVNHPPSLTESRFLAVCLLAFAAFLRFEELVEFTCCDVKFYDHMEVASKTDQLREGATEVVARSRSHICPVGEVGQYMKTEPMEPSSTERLFRAITATKLGEKLRKGGHAG